MVQIDYQVQQYVPQVRINDTGDQKQTHEDRIYVSIPISVYLDACSLYLSRLLLTASAFLQSTTGAPEASRSSRMRAISGLLAGAPGLLEALRARNAIPLGPLCRENTDLLLTLDNR